MADPIAFMVMPFNLKETGRTEQDVPSRIDFDALWDRVYRPTLEDAGYVAVRADQDVGALIISQMIQRLALADLVVADITLANANVYYEVGVRHAAKAHGCVLVGADWTRPVFDLGQMRQLRFPLTDGAVGDAAVVAARQALTDGLEALTHGLSPVFDALPGYPGAAPGNASAFKDAVAELSRFDGDVRAIRTAPTGERGARTQDLLGRYGNRPVVRDAVALELIRLVRDNVGWAATLAYIETLPKHLATHPLVIEQRALALSGTGEDVSAAGALLELVDRLGETPERLGMLGGRFKRLYSQADHPADKRRYLDEAIHSYQRGMTLDLNSYYCSSNLPRLYRARGQVGDDRLAAEAELATGLACRATIERGTEDEWARSTLLGNAFDRGDVAEAAALADQVAMEGTAKWQLASTISDLRASAAHHADPAVRAGLAAPLSQLEALLPPTQP